MLLRLRPTWVRCAFAILLSASACFSEAGSAGTGGSGDTGSSETVGCELGSEGCECTAGGSCDAGLVCISHTCLAPAGASSSPEPDDDSSGGADDDSSSGGLCGNGVLDEGELCDEANGCVDCVLVDYPCNPYNQVGCGEVQTCDRTRGATLNDQRTGCFQEGQAGWGAPCIYDPLDPALQCADGLSCVGGAYHPNCTAAECCTEFCDLTDPSTCPDPTTQCLTWKEVGMPAGLDDLGLCIRL
jgi:hypothetical protein